MVSRSQHCITSLVWAGGVAGPPFHPADVRGAPGRGRLAVQRGASVRQGVESPGERHSSARRGRVSLYH